MTAISTGVRKVLFILTLENLVGYNKQLRGLIAATSRAYVAFDADVHVLVLIWHLGGPPVQLDSPLWSRSYGKENFGQKMRRFDQAGLDDA